MQDQITARRPDSHSRLTSAKNNLRGETERALGEIAFALQLTRTVKKAILEEKPRGGLAK